LEPHPLHPFLATSGLDHDVKIWTPNSNEPVDFDKIESVIVHVKSIFESFRQFKYFMKIVRLRTTSLRRDDRNSDFNFKI
jgi:hypothetical protein